MFSTPDGNIKVSCHEKVIKACMMSHLKTTLAKNFWSPAKKLWWVKSLLLLSKITLPQASIDLVCGPPLSIDLVCGPPLSIDLVCGPPLSIDLVCVPPLFALCLTTQDNLGPSAVSPQRQRFCPKRPLRFAQQIFSGEQTKKLCLEGQSHEKVYEFWTWDGSFSLN
jgi:hypothetical protein